MIDIMEHPRASSHSRVDDEVHKLHKLHKLLGAKTYSIFEVKAYARRRHKEGTCDILPAGEHWRGYKSSGASIALQSRAALVKYMHL